MVTLTANMTVMTAAARKVGVRLKRDYGEVEQLQISRKGPADFVSAADVRTEQKLVEELSHARPDWGFLLEEGGEIKGKDETMRWIIDPIDGTTNFLHGIPNFAMSIALEEQGKITAALVYEPATEQMFRAEKGGGAFLNDRRMRVSSRQVFRECLFATGIPYMGRGDEDYHDKVLAQVKAVIAVSSGIRRFGSAALDLAYVAAGRFDGFWETGLKPWGIAAGILLVREAGGMVSEVSGADRMLKTGSVLAANPHVHQPLGDLIRKVGEKI